MKETQLPSQIGEEEGDLGELLQNALRVAQSGRWWILLTGLGTLLLTVIGLSFVSNVYRSEATILVVEQQIPQNLIAPLSNMTGAQKLQVMTQEVLSRSSLLKIINDTHLFANKKLEPDEADELFRKSIDITPGATRDGAIGSFTISFSASTPKMAEEVTRMLASLFIERHSEKQVNRATSTASFVKERVTEKKKRATELERRIRDLKSRYAGSLPESRVANDTRMAELRSQLQNTISNLSRTNQQRVIWESMLSGNLNAQLGRLKTERAALLSRFTPKHPEVRRRDEEIAQLERLIANSKAGPVSPKESSGRFASSDATVAQLQGQIEANRVEAENLSQDQKRFETMIAELQRQIGTTPVLEQQLTSMERESEGLNQEIAKLDGMEQQSTMSVDMERQQQGEQFRLLDLPSLPLRPVSPARFKIGVGAGACGLLLGFALAFVVDMRKGCFQTEQQIRQKYAPWLVLSIPELLTATELHERRRRAGIEWAAGALVMVTMLAIDFYLYKYS